MLWMVRSLALTLLIGVAAYCVESALRGHSTRTRWVWAIALLLSALLPLAAIAPRELWPARLHSPPILSALHPTVAEEPPVAASLRLDDLELVSTEIRVGRSDSRPYMLWLWLAASSFFLLRYLYGWMRLQQARRRWQPARLADDVVLISDGLGPAVVGVFRTRLVVPHWVMTAPTERQRMILQHEREHALARDHLLLGIAPLLAILFPWNLGVWWQLRRFRLAVECDCDARVLRAGTARAAYGAMLLDVATTRTGLNFGVAGLIEPRSLLQRRIEAMKAGQIRKSLTRVVMLEGSAVVSLAAALLLTVPPTLAVQAQSGGRIQQTPANGDLLYVVDGKVLGRRPSLDAAALGVNVGRITVLSPAAARARYGEQGANGAVVITARRPAPTTTRNRGQDATQVSPPTVVTAVPVETPVPTTTVRPQPDSLARVDVRTTETPPAMRVLRYNNGDDPLIVVDGVVQGQARPMILIDGEESKMTQRELRLIDPKTIDSVEVIKGEAAVRLYGERARDGVIVIKSKRD